MFRFIREVAHILLADEDLSILADGEDDERREDARFAFEGTEVPIRSRGVDSTMHIKNLSCGGVCGVTPIPVPVGGTVVLSLPNLPPRTAEVRWVRNTTMGLKFDRPLSFSQAIRFFAGTNDEALLYRAGAPTIAAECMLAANDA